MKRRLPVILATGIGAFLVVQYGITQQSWLGGQMNTVYQWFNDWYSVGAAMVIIVAVGNILRIHIQKVRRLSPQWGYSLIVILSMLGYALASFVPKFDIGGSGDWIYENVYRPLDSSMFSLLAFYIASAAYRAFRVRNVEATIMLFTAVVIMIGRVPLGSYVSSQLPSLVSWILIVPAMAAKRGILIGVALGIIATSMKIILGIEKPYLGGTRR